MKLKIGFIGLGAMGLSHIKSMHLGCAQHAEAVAICGRNEANIKKALEVAPKASVFKDENALINSDLDAIFIATPNFLHVPQALQALGGLANMSSWKSRWESTGPSVCACWEPRIKPTAC